MDEITVRAVDLGHLEPGPERAARCLAPGLLDGGDVGRRHLAGHLAALAERHRARADRLPRRLALGVVVLVERAEADPGTLDLRLAPAVAELDRGHRAVGLEKGGDPSEWADLRVRPEVGAAVGLAPAGLDLDLLGEDDVGAADREPAGPHEVPVSHRVVDRRGLSHRRDHRPVAHLQSAKLDRGTESRSRALGFLHVAFLIDWRPKGGCAGPRDAAGTVPGALARPRSV